MAAAATEREAKEAFSSGEFERSVELYTKVINAGSATADLYAERALALVRLGNYHEALVDANKAIDLNPCMAKAYYRKAEALWNLKEYESAKLAIQVGKANDPHSLSTESGEASSQYRYYFYNTPREVVLMIRARGSNVKVHFDVEMLNVSFDVLGESPCHFQAELSSKNTALVDTFQKLCQQHTSQIVPEKCKCQVFSRRIEIRLAKVEHLTWKTLSKQRMTDSVEYEFSWKNRRFKGQNIIPSVRQQGQTRTCVFQAMTAAAEIELKKESACLDPPEPCKLKFSTNAFIADYERIEGYIPDDNPPNGRTQRALEMFMQEGVLARGRGVARGKKKIKGFHKMKNLHFEDMKMLIKEGRPVVGSLKLDDTFAELEPGDIYDYEPMRQIETDAAGVPASHAVVFIGHGVRDGRAYLVFLNSYGEGYCEGGFGRVYFGHAYNFYTIDV